MTRMTTPVLTITIAALKRADSLTPTTRNAVRKTISKRRGQVDDGARQMNVVKPGSRQRRVGERSGKDETEILQEAHEIA